MSIYICPYLLQEEKKIVLSTAKKEYKIIGIVNDHYIVKTHRGLKEVKIDMRNKKKINDEIKIENLMFFCFFVIFKFLFIIF